MATASSTKRTPGKPRSGGSRTRRSGRTPAAGRDARARASKPPATPDTCPRCGGTGFYRRDVPVGHPDFGRALPCDCQAAAQQAARLEGLRQASNLGMLKRQTFESFVPDGYGLAPHVQANLHRAYETCRAYAEDPQGWVVLRGRYGCGKTHLAAAIANRRIAQGHLAVFMVVPDLLDYLRAAYRPDSDTSYDEQFDAVRNAPLLILDDLGTQSSTPWAQEKLFQLLNYRYNALLPTVITTNRELEEINARLRSRLADTDLCQVVTILAPDFRQAGTESSELSSLSLHSDQTFDEFDTRGRELQREERENLRQALETARGYAAEPEGWLVFQGDYGCGKTHLAAAIANDRAARGQPALFVVVPDLLDHLRATFSPTSSTSLDRLFEEVRNAPLLVLDDLGTQSSTPWAQEKLYQLLNHRYNARLPTVITTNLTMEEIDGRLRARILDPRRVTVYAILAPSYLDRLSTRQNGRGNGRDAPPPRRRSRRS